MKKLITYTALAALSLAACAPEDHDDINVAARPSASDISVDLVMLDSNKVQFNLLNTGCTPVWYFDDKSQSTINGIIKQYPIAGDYSVEIKMYNRNGICDGSMVKEFSFTQTFLNFDSETAKLTDGSSKTWQIARSKEGHLGCGESADNPTGWWKGTPDTKAGTGLYDDKFTFAADGTYTYNPGADGLTYINYGTSVLGSTGATEDYDVATNEQTGTWKFEYRGSTLYLVLSSHSLLGYLAHDSQYEKPEFIVKQVSSKEITLVWSCPDISWQYIIVPESAEPPVENLWNNIIEKTEFYYAPGWSQIADPEFSQNGGNFKASFPSATSDTWQAQVKLFTPLGATSEKNYDFSVVFTPNKDHGNITVKLTDSGDDNNFLFAEKVNVTGGKPNEIKFKGVKGIDAEKLTLVFDFGGNPENFDVEISDIVFNEHKGAIEVPVWTYNPDGDVTKGLTYETTTYYAHGDSWEGLSTNVLTDKGNGVWQYTLPDASNMQWQAQLAFISQLEISAGKKYDYHVKFLSTTDISGVTVKVTDVATDGISPIVKNIDLEAGVEYEFIVNGVDGQDITVEDKLDDNGNVTAHGGVKFVFDFGGNPANTDITISEMILQESK